MYGIKSQVLKFKNDGEKWCKKFYFEILQAPKKLPANLPGPFSLPGQIFFLHLAAATLKQSLKCLIDFQTLKTQKYWFQDLRF